MNNISFLAIEWANAGIKAAQLILSLSLIVIVHEFGHFLPSKLFKCRVEKFFLFFDPWFSLVKKKIGDTVYGIGWLPLGGYVKIAGMVDESMDKDQMNQPPQPWEFRSKPAWQRLIIMLGGVTMNVLMAFVIYAMILFAWGQKKMPMSGLTDGVAVSDSLMYHIGFRNGDKILSVNGDPVVYFDDLPKKILLGGGGHVEIIRDGVHQNIDLPMALIGKLVERKKNSPVLFMPRIPVIADQVPDSSNAHTAGLRRLDQIVAVDGIATPFFEEFKNVISAHAGGSVTIAVKRNSSVDTLQAMVRADSTLGFYRLVDPEILDSLGLIHIEKTSYGFFASFPAGVHLAFETLGSYVDQFKKNSFSKNRSIQRCWWFQGNGFNFSIHVGLAVFLDHHGILFHCTCIYEYSANTCPGWRSCFIYGAGDDHRSQTQPKTPGIRSGCGHGIIAGTYDLCKWQ